MTKTPPLLPLAPTVLPLNQDGSVFHLCLREGELAQTVILVGDSDRVDIVASYFDCCQVNKRNREFKTRTGVLQGKAISVVSTGIGSSGVEIALNEMDALHNIDLGTRQIKSELTSMNIIRLGTCGGLDARILPDQFIISQYALGFDGSLRHYQYPQSQQEQDMLSSAGAHFKEYALNSSIYAAQADAFWLDKLSALGERGITFTCPGFYAAQQRALRLPVVHNSALDMGANWQFDGVGVLNFEMETAMILGLGRALGHRCASVSSVVFNRITQSGSQDYKKAIESMIEQTLSIVVESI